MNVSGLSPVALWTRDCYLSYYIDKASFATYGLELTEGKAVTPPLTFWPEFWVLFLLDRTTFRADNKMICKDWFDVNR